MSEDIKNNDTEEILEEEFTEETDEEVEEIEEEISGDSETKKLQSEIAELKDQLLRNRAEFDNFRKRTANEKTQMYNNATADCVLELLPVLDNFERSAETVTADEEYKKGVLMILTQFQNAFKKIGVEVIPALGEEFDPKFHNAIKTIETEEYESGKVCQEFQKGYKYKDKVIRHSVVGVAE
jgi:molecular chaperone GrpE